MATKLIQESTLTNIANAIRAKTGKVDTMTPSEMVTEIGSISGGGDSELVDLIANTLSTLTNNDVTKVGSFGLARRTFSSVSLPNCTSIAQQGFESCSSLTSVDLPSCAAVGSSAFRYCGNLSSIKLPSLTLISGTTFQSCGALQLADFGNPTSIGSSAFYSTANLKIMIIRKSDNICTLSNQNAFINSGMLGTDARIYVPQSLITQYQQGTNWSVVYADNNNLFQPLEGSPYENPNYDPTLLLAS